MILSKIADRSPESIRCPCASIVSLAGIGRFYLGTGANLRHVQIRPTVLEGGGGGGVNRPLAHRRVLGRRGPNESEQCHARSRTEGRSREILDVWIEDDEDTIPIGADPERP